MEYSMNAVAKKMILVVIGLSVLFSAAAFGLFAIFAGNVDLRMLGTIMGINNIEESEVLDAIPFIAGIGMAMGVNILKIVLLKRAVTSSLNREPNAAKLYLKGQYFFRLVVTGAVLLVAGLLHAYALNEAGNPQVVNLMGAFFGIFTYTFSAYLMRYFFKDELQDNPELFTTTKESANKGIQNAIEELESIGVD